jgi:RNA polymerase sigma factor for flagellar operon FliA
MINATLEDYRSLVYQCAHRMRVGKPACVELDDLIQAGMIGLMEARQRFEPTHGATFAGFACTRIQGAMLDELRGNDWMSRRERRLHRDIDQAVCRLQHRHFRTPRDEEIAIELGLNLLEYQGLWAIEGLIGPVPLNEQMVSDHPLPEDEDNGPSAFELVAADISAEPSTMLQQHQMCRALASAIAALPQRQQCVMDMYYTQDVSLKDTLPLMLLVPLLAFSATLPVPVTVAVTGSETSTPFRSNVAPRRIVVFPTASPSASLWATARVPPCISIGPVKVLLLPLSVRTFGPCLSTLPSPVIDRSKMTSVVQRTGNDAAVGKAL